MSRHESRRIIMRPVIFVIDATHVDPPHRSREIIVGDDKEGRNHYAEFVSALQQSQRPFGQVSGSVSNDGEEYYTNRYIKEGFSSFPRHLHRVGDGIVEYNNDDNDDDNDDGDSSPGGMAYISISARHALPPSKYPRGKMPQMANDNVTNVNGPATTNYNNIRMANEQQSPQQPRPSTSSSHSVIGGRVTPTPPSSTSWISSYEIWNEGIISNHWLEKHTRILPSSVLIVTTLPTTPSTKTKSNDPPTADMTDNEQEQQQQRQNMEHVTTIIANLRSMLPEKRRSVVAIYLVCLLADDDDERRQGAMGGGELRGRICQQCNLPDTRVVFIPVPSSSTTKTIEQHVERLDESVRRASGIYYSTLAFIQERKLALWRTRYYNANVTSEGHTLLAAMRCARYAMKVGTLRELQCKTLLRFGRDDGNGNSNSGGGNYQQQEQQQQQQQLLWTDKSSTAMKHYNEAYRWVIELHRRSVSCRMAMTVVASPATTTMPRSPAPTTPGAGHNILSSPSGGGSTGGGGGAGGGGVKYNNSPNATESPGGGIGFEISLLSPNLSSSSSSSSATAAIVPPPPPPPTSTPKMNKRGGSSNSSNMTVTSREGYGTEQEQNRYFFASMYEQCRIVASILNTKLLHCTTSTTTNSNKRDDDTTTLLGDEIIAEEQWHRHSTVFLSNPLFRGEEGGNNDVAFFGPAWYHHSYITQELLTYASIAEMRWRRCRPRAKFLQQANVALAASTTDQNIDTTTTASNNSSSFHKPGAPWKIYSELCEAVLNLRRAILRHQSATATAEGKGQYVNEWIAASSTYSGRDKFIGSIVCRDDGMSWQFANQMKFDYLAVALDYALHALDLLQADGLSSASPCQTGDITVGIGTLFNESPAAARLHYLAARLLLNMDDPTGALVHLKIASAQTKLWPSLHLAIQRVLFACTERCDMEKTNPSLDDAHNSYIELLLRPGSCKLLSPVEMMMTQAKVWPLVGCTDTTSTKEIVWTHNDACNTKPPFEFAVSYLNSTHASSCDTVTVCISMKSCLGVQVLIDSMQLLTTSGVHNVPNLEHHKADRSQSSGNISFTTKYGSDQGIKLNPNELVFLFAELIIPSNLTLPDGSAIDTLKFTPKNGRWTNTGLSRAAGNICESKFNGSVSEVPPSFHGGVPLVCNGVVLRLRQGGSNAMLNLQIMIPNLISPLQRSGALRLLMEETNYTSHSWSRPITHPWCFGPRVIRVLGPQPRLTITNLTGPLTNYKAVKGTVNRNLLQLETGNDAGCWDVRIRLKCTTITEQEEESANKSHTNATFVQIATTNSAAQAITEIGVALPDGWEPRQDVGVDEFHNTTTLVSPYIEADKSLIFPLDIFYPLDELESVTTTFEVIITYRQEHCNAILNNTENSDDLIMVILSGLVEWVPPFTAEFGRPIACGIQHSPNIMSLQSTHIEPVIATSDVDTGLIFADGECIRMKCSLEATGIGSDNVAATILRVTNKDNSKGPQDVYTSDSPLFRNQLKRGSRLFLSYSATAQKLCEGGDNGDETIHLGGISVDWKPLSLYLPNDLKSLFVTADDKFGSAHGPLDISGGLMPFNVQGPQCQISPSLFKVELLNIPATPKVGTPFCITHQVTNLTAEIQTLTLQLRLAQGGVGAVDPTPPQLLCAGKVKDEVQVGPYECRTFSFTFMSLVTGKVCMPQLTIYSGRHQNWVIKETLGPPRYLFVTP